MKLRQIPARVAAGAYLINSGINKLDLPEETVASLQDLGAQGVPQIKQIDRAQFGKLLAYGEIAMGGLLLLPFVPGWLAGLPVTAFSAGLLNAYRKTPGMTVDGIRPTQEGIGMAKDVFLLGIGGSLVLDAFTGPSKRQEAKRERKGRIAAEKQAAKAEKIAAKAAAKAARSDD